MLAAFIGWFAYFQRFYVHQHCIVQTGFAFRAYEEDHQGRLPFDTNGFGDALMLLVKGGYLGDVQNGWRFVTGVGDDGSLFKAALASGGHVPEEKCSRVYVQGLGQMNDFNIAVLFDRYSSHGGDHFRRPWGPLVREVSMLDGSMQIVKKKNWDGFSSQQIELLVQNGIPRATAQHYYALTKR